MLYYITSILLLIYNLIKGSNCKAKLERSQLWQENSSWRKSCERG